MMPGQNQICQNLLQAYSTRLRDSAKELRRLEKEHLDRVTELYGGSFPELIQAEPLEIANNDQIADLVSQMNDLTALFRDIG